MSASTTTSARRQHPDAIPDDWWTDTLHAYGYQPTHGHHDPTTPDAYAERAWLQLVGPTAFLATRRLCLELHDGSEVAWPVDQFARSLGVGVPALRNAIHRLERARLVHIDGHRLAVHTAWPDLTPRQLARLARPLPAGQPR